MALSSQPPSQQQLNLDDVSIPKGLLKVEESIRLRLGNCGFHSNDMILQILYCIKCDVLSSFPGKMYVTTERIFFIANAAYLDFGFHLSRLESIMVDSSDLPITTFVLDDATYSFMSIDEREDLYRLLATAFPKLEIRYTQGNQHESLPLNSEHFSDYVDKTTVTPSYEENSSKQKVLENTFAIQRMEKRTCKYYLANAFCPLLPFCGKEHSTKDQFDNRIKAFHFSFPENDVETNGEEMRELFNGSESKENFCDIVKSKQEEVGHPLLLRHIKHRSLSDLVINNTNISDLTDNYADNIENYVNSIPAMKRSNSLEFFDPLRTSDVHFNEVFDSGPILSSGKLYHGSTDQLFDHFSHQEATECFKLGTPYPGRVSQTILDFVSQDVKPIDSPGIINQNRSMLDSPTSQQIPNIEPIQLVAPHPSPNKQEGQDDEEVIIPRYPNTPPELASYGTNLTNSMISQLDFAASSDDDDDDSTEDTSRAPCQYFFAGYCRDGDSCKYFHFNQKGQYPSEMLQQMISNQPLTLPNNIKLLLVSEIGREDLINTTDKIILAPTILAVCEQKNLEYPITFSLTNTTSNKNIYVGVLEFTGSEHEIGYVPQWILDHLEINSGDEVALKHEILPKGVFCRLQPLSSSWLSIPYEKRTDILEFFLKKFQNLTVGMRIDVVYEMNKYSHKVLQCKPARGICIVNADIQTDIIEPYDCDELYSPEEGQAQGLCLDTPLKCSLPAKTYRHFVLIYTPYCNHPERIKIALEAIEGDPDLYVSQLHNAPTQSLYQWCCQDVGSATLQLSSTTDDLYDPKKSLYVGVMCFNGNCTFKICFHRDDALQITQPGTSKMDRSSGIKLRSVNSPSNSPTPLKRLIDNPPIGHLECTHCGVFMAPIKLAMHERHCKNSAFKCPDCFEVLPIEAKDKHYLISHVLLVCSCKQEFTQNELNQHQRNNCQKRIVSCSHKWCTLSFPLDEIHQHETTCGTRRIPCSICNEDVYFIELEAHMFGFHDIDVSRINWAISLGAQSLPKNQNSSNDLQCDCGAEFTQIDDFQVHQLTSCPLREEESNYSFNSEDIATSPSPVPVSENHVNNEVLQRAEQLDLNASAIITKPDTCPEGQSVNSNSNKIRSKYVPINEINELKGNLNEISSPIVSTNEQYIVDNQRIQPNLNSPLEQIKVNLTQNNIPENDLVQNDTPSQLLSTINGQNDSNNTPNLAQKEISDI